MRRRRTAGPAAGRWYGFVLLVAMLAGGCGMFQGYRFPSPKPPLGEDSARVIDLNL